MQNIQNLPPRNIKINLAKFLHDCLPYMWIVEPNLPDGAVAGYYQPLFFWEGIANLGMFCLLYFGAEFIPFRKAGDMGAFYITWYGALRLGLEPLRDSNFKSEKTIILSAIFVAIGAIFIIINHLVLCKVRDKKIWHTLHTRGPKEVFKMIGAGWKPEKNVQYQDAKFADCVRTEPQKIYFGMW